MGGGIFIIEYQRLESIFRLLRIQDNRWLAGVGETRNPAIDPRIFFGMAPGLTTPYHSRGNYLRFRDLMESDMSAFKPEGGVSIFTNLAF